MLTSKYLSILSPQAPAAFGLVSFLMHSGLEKKYIQGHLLAFSAAAPVVAIPTYFILHGVRHVHLSHRILVRKETFIWVKLGVMDLVCLCCSLAIHHKGGSLPQVWGCSSRPGLSSTWPRCTFSLRSAVAAAAGRSIPHLTSNLTPGPSLISINISGSKTASLSSWGLHCQ